MVQDNFELDSRLANDCEFVLDLPLSRVLLMNDTQYPWFILVPRRTGTTELFELSSDELAQFWHESRQLSLALMALFNGDKLNIAALGNVVSQLHVHHVVRYKGDIAWPHPVWGRYPTKGYEPELLATRVEQVKTWFATQA